MSDHSSWAGLRPRAAIGGTALWLLLGSPAASAFQLGALHFDSTPGAAYSAYVPVVLGPGERLDYLIVDAHARVAGGSVPLAVQLSSSPEPRIELSAPMALPGNTTVDLDARLGDAHIARAYAPAQAAAPAPVYAAPIAPPPPAEAAPSYPPPAPPVAAAPQPFYAPPPPYNPGGIYIRPVVEAGYEIGGDRLLEVQCTETYSDGSTDTSSPSLRSGTGFVAGGGAHVRPNRASPYDLRVTIDYKYASVCGSASMERVRFTFLPSYRFGTRPASFWAGAGLIYETGIKFHGGGLQYQGYNVPDLKFNDAVGGTVQLGWWFLALDYNFIKYRYDGTNNGFHTSANSVGLIFTYAFDFF